MIRVLVTGGRNYHDAATVWRVLGRLHRDGPIGSLVHGDAPGADSLAGQWAIDNRITVVAMPADWKTDGRSAGPKRNARMLDLGPSLVVAFPGGTGTADMVARARQAFVPVLRVGADDPADTAELEALRRIARAAQGFVDVATDGVLEILPEHESAYGQRLTDLDALFLRLSALGFNSNTQAAE